MARKITADMIRRRGRAEDARRFEIFLPEGLEITEQALKTQYTLVDSDMLARVFLNRRYFFEYQEARDKAFREYKKATVTALFEALGYKKD